MSFKLPFQERKTPWRGCLDLITGCYPTFLFGATVGDLLPVFHFHDVTADYLENYLRYLAENQYRTVCSDDIWRLARDGGRTGPRAVALCFDDAWASIWTVVYPLLQRYNMTAITYVIPNRVADAPAPRPLHDQPLNSNIPLATEPLATWQELRALHNSGVVDVQAHTLHHAMVFCHDQVTGFITPNYSPPDFTAPPVPDNGDAPHFLTAQNLGYPLYPTRSRCADARRFCPDTAGVKACQTYVHEHGGSEYFAQSDWEAPLRAIMQKHRGRYETWAEAEKNILHEIGAAREILNTKLNTNTVRHICFPWAIAGQIAENAARQSGYLSAFADRLFGRRTVRAGNNPYRLMRLKHQYIYALPGRPRRNFFQLR